MKMEGLGNLNFKCGNWIMVNWGYFSIIYGENKYPEGFLIWIGKYLLLWMSKGMKVH